ncbi:MAG: DegT/DnrJ/EryC1/StrS family aminotransferase [Firmicutes bacterium]|nr:DegT/DnrJ/EryC1/StrS family aminotransferase [Bacillota bacterium]HPU02206.1 DegT/DnrJ/EryC1/StrS family aminotransferase [Bacillota bacterium]
MPNCSKPVQIPSFDLTRQNAELKDELLEALASVIERGQFILGENVSAFEKEVARLCGVKFGIGVGNGSDALYLALLALGIGPGDEVITTPFTFFATAGSIARTGARPVFVDIDAATWNLDPALIEAKITPRTRAILPVHLYGCPAEMGAIVALAEKYNLKIIEDAAQAIGAAYKGKKVGSFGDAACLSFFPTKNLGAFGDAGMVVTDNPDLADKVRLLRVHGARPKYYHQLLGVNSRLDELQAAVLKLKLEHLSRWNERRRSIASLYSQLLKGLAEEGLLRLPSVPEGMEHIFHQYTIQAGERDKLQAWLKERGIGSTIYYPQPLHLQKVFASYGHKEGDFPVAERAAREVLSLPMFPELTDDEVKIVAEAIIEFFKR